jgi:Flp pilus assembly protein TadB
MELALAFLSAAGLGLGLAQLLQRWAPGPRRAGWAPRRAAPEEAAPGLAAAVLMAVWPSRFDPSRARGRENVVALLRRAGYPYPSVAAFYAAAARDLAGMALVGGMLAGLAGLGGAAPVGVVLAALAIFYGLRRPYARLRARIRRRTERTRQNMLPTLALLEAMLDAGLGTTEALRRAAALRGPFANLLEFLLAQLNAQPSVAAALDRLEEHLPDPQDPETQIFVGDLRAHLLRQAPLRPAVASAAEAAARRILYEAEARASRVQRQAGLWGILAVGGLVITLLGSVFLTLF